MILNINDQEYEIADQNKQMLLWVLRDELGLTGVKFGCGAGICGSCTVHIDGVATRTCITTPAAAEGKEIRTIEGLYQSGCLTLYNRLFWMCRRRNADGVCPAR